MPKTDSFHENHRGGPTVTLLKVLSVLGVLNLLNVLNVRTDCAFYAQGRIIGLLGLVNTLSTFHP